MYIAAFVFVPLAALESAPGSDFSPLPLGLTAVAPPRSRWKPPNFPVWVWPRIISAKLFYSAVIQADCHTVCKVNHAVYKLLIIVQTHRSVCLFHTSLHKTSHPEMLLPRYSFFLRGANVNIFPIKFSADSSQYHSRIEIFHLLSFFSNQ